MQLLLMQFLTRILFQDFKDCITKPLFFSFQVEKKKHRRGKNLASMNFYKSLKNSLSMSHVGFVNGNCKFSDILLPLYIQIGNLVFI